ncbi:MAG: DUF2155 domain-containing protein [Deferribacteraceae bacterium]|jgi:hypothetical protein|nr:DUF2155 domain-containing protein [Deferribacteraceae bacterium]
MKLVTVLLAVLLFAACSQNSKKSGAAPFRASTPSASPATQTIADDILARYSGVTVEILEYETGKKTAVDIPFNETVQAEGFPLAISILQFYPDFKMSEGSNFFTASLEPNNVAARVNIVSDGYEFSGWLFAEYPDMHPLDNPKYNVILLKALEK